MGSDNGEIIGSVSKIEGIPDCSFYFFFQLCRIPVDIGWIKKFKKNSICEGTGTY